MNPKHEIRSTKQARKTNDRMPQTAVIVWCLCFESLSNFVLPISCLKAARYIRSRYISLVRSRVMSAEAKLVELNLQLPPIPKPGGVYKPVVIVGNMAYCSGHVSVKSDGSIMTGCVGSEVDQDYGKKAA